MEDGEFKQWLERRGARTASGRNTRTHAVRTIENKLAELGSPHVDLEAAWQADGFAHLRARLKELRDDFVAGGSDYRILMPESAKPLGRLRNWGSWLGQYGQFLSGEAANDKIADRIRGHVLEAYIEPARERDDDAVEVLVRDINEALELNQAWPNICQALKGRTLLQMGDLSPPEQIGAEQSSATVFRYHLKQSASPTAQPRSDRPFLLFDEAGAAFKPVLNYNRATGRSAYRVKPPGASNRADEAIELEDLADVAKAILVDRRPARIQSVSGGSVNYLAYGKQKLVRYELDPAIAQAIGVPATGSVDDGPWLDRQALETLRSLFLDRHSDFRTFDDSGSFGPSEDNYKRALVARTAAILANQPADTAGAVGTALLDLLEGRGGLENNLLGWRMANGLAAVRKAHPGTLEAAAEALARTPDPVAAVADFVEQSWPLLAQGQEKSLPYGDSRTIPTMLRALVDPVGMFGIRSTPTDNAAIMLLGRRIFSAQLKPNELRSAITLAEQIFAVMRDDWHWAPRDLWDVQGFIWETCQKRTAPAENDQRQISRTQAPMTPTNLILYGPPGTGKTYATAKEALRLCGESAAYPDTPAGRDELMASYRTLVAARQIEFVTFHQNFCYEEFVEGLRPETGTGDEAGETGNQAGFRLQPQPGVFREIAFLADQARKAKAGRSADDLKGRRIFKMSLGRAGIEDQIFQDAIDGGYAVMGWGGDIDWTPYTSYDAIHERWNQDHPGTNGNDANIVQTSRFRADMREGDIIVVSYGNKSFRAIGEVTGPYTFAPTETRDYNHRRTVNWLKVFDDPVPVDLIYDRPFSQRSCYLLNEQHLNRQALANLLPGENAETAPGAPKQFVLIIDEINRANISKVFGELITLVEPDKRLGMPNALTVRLPYSKREFGVPANLHIIGTMNTADRSIALLDTALRRRFEFRELMPDPELLGTVDGIDLAALLTAINERIEYLFDREHQIGHAYFMGCATRAELDEVMRHKVIPLLAEYFYEDWAKVAAILGDGDDGEGDREGGFIDRKRLKAPRGMGSDEDAAPRYRWSVRDAFSYDGFRAG